MRVTSWHDHLKRGLNYNHFSSILLDHQDADWLMRMRSAWVSVNSSLATGGRNSLHAGRTGTRRNIGRPQVRWVDGVEIARVVSQGRSMAKKGNNAITIRPMIKEAVAQAHGVAQSFFDPDT